MAGANFVAYWGGVYQFRIGVKRSGTADTLTSADLAFRKDGVSV